MKTRLLFILSLIVLPCMALRAQTNGGAVLRTGDVIELRLAGVPSDETEFNAPFTIDENGMINLPLLNQVKVAGMLPSEIQDTLQKRLVDGKFFTHPVITVQMGAVPRYVNMSGEVRANGRIAWTADMTLMTAITAANGVTEYFGDKIELTRDGKTTAYSMKDLHRGKVEDPKVLPGDKINLVKSFF